MMFHEVSVNPMLLPKVGSGHDLDQERVGPPKAACPHPPSPNLPLNSYTFLLSPFLNAAKALIFAPQKTIDHAAYPAFFLSDGLHPDGGSLYFLRTRIPTTAAATVNSHPSCYSSI